RAAARRRRQCDLSRHRRPYGRATDVAGSGDGKTPGEEVSEGCMALVWIPPLLRDLTQGNETATVPGANARQLIEALEKQFPGVRARLCQDDGLRPGLAVIVDGQVGRHGLLETIGPDSEVHFLPAIAGG